MKQTPSPRTITLTGLGASADQPCPTPASAVGPPDEQDGRRTARPTVRVPVDAPRAQRTDATRPPLKQRSGDWCDDTSPPPSSDTRPRRPYVSVDDVGRKVVRSAAHARGDSKPRVLVDRQTLAAALNDDREALLVLLIDGTMTVAELIAHSRMPEGNAVNVLERLTRLGIISLR